MAALGKLACAIFFDTDVRFDLLLCLCSFMSEKMGVFWDLHFYYDSMDMSVSYECVNVYYFYKRYPFRRFVPIIDL